MNVGIVGLGLIGGSIAKSIKLETTHTVMGADLVESTVHKARLLEAIDLELTDERLSICDMILVALYPRDIVTWVKEKAPLFKSGSLVVDLGGVKETICEELFAHAQANDYCFVGGHPMAGVERWGFDNARSTMFDRASMLLVPPKGMDLARLQELKKFFGALGFGQVLFTTPQDHDRRIAYTSQLAHVVSSAYVKSPTAQMQHGFSAGSYKDMTRVAHLNETMWSELFMENADFLEEEIRHMIGELERFGDALRRRDGQEVKELLREGRELKEQADLEDMRE